MIVSAKCAIIFQRLKSNYAAINYNNDNDCCVLGVHNVKCKLKKKKNHLISENKNAYITIYSGFFRKIISINRYHLNVIARHMHVRETTITQCDRTTEAWLRLIFL